jgi:hypothetical protein
MHDKDGTLGLAMLFASAKTTEGRTTAELVLRGAQAEKDGVIKTDGVKETGWKATIANQIRGAYSNREVEDNVLRASFLIAGATTGDVDRAVRLATGGIIDFNGSKVPMPYGMAADGQSSGEKKFNKAIEAITPDSLAAQVRPSQVSGSFAGLIEKGNIDLASRPQVKNQDGSVSTVRSIGVNIDGKEVLLPTVSDDGKLLTDQQAIDSYRRTGKHLGKFDTPEQASAYAQQLHAQQESAYGPGAKLFVRVGSSRVSLNDFVKALPDAQLAHGGQGVYYVKAGTQFVTNEEGKPLAIRIAP